MTIESVIPAFDSRQQPSALYDAIRDTLKVAPGFKLFTILSCEHEKQLVQRIYTSHPDGTP